MQSIFALIFVCNDATDDWLLEHVDAGSSAFGVEMAAGGLRVWSTFASSDSIAGHLSVTLSLEGEFSLFEFWVHGTCDSS